MSEEGEVRAPLAPSRLLFVAHAPADERGAHVRRRRRFVALLSASREVIERRPPSSPRATRPSADLGAPQIPALALLSTPLFPHPLFFPQALSLDPRTGSRPSNPLALSTSSTSCTFARATMVKTKLLKTAYLWTAAMGWWDTGADPLMPSDFRVRPPPFLAARSHGPL